MSNTARIAATAANTLSKPLNVEDVFSTYLYEGNGSTQTITNGIDLSGEGGLVWIKDRTSSSNQHSLNDTERGATKYLKSSSTDAEGTGDLTSFNSNGFSVRYQQTGYINENGMDLASWTFRKAPKFFDVVTYTGTGSAQNISHNLGSVPGMIITKRTDGAGNWVVYHRGADATAPEDKYAFLETTTQFLDAPLWNDTAPTDTQFSLGVYTNNNDSGGSYVAYLFAHNDGDGDFGPTADQDIIKCGSFTSTSGTDEIDLGFEPQWILIKRADASNSWVLVDELRGNPVGSAANYLEPNGTFAESTLTGWTTPTPTGFTNSYPLAGGTFIYVAIRRGPMAVPESATDVFAIDTIGSTGDGKAPHLRAPFPVDMSIRKRLSGGETAYNVARLISGKALSPDSTAAEVSIPNFDFDYMNGWGNYTNTNSDYYGWMWKRAPNFFDVVAYTGAGATQTINHNLGVKPEAILIKQRSGTTGWIWWYDAFGDNQTFIRGDLSNATFTNTTYFNNTAPTDTQITLGFHSNVNGSTSTDYIAYLFASLDGISKVGSYTGNGTSQNIDCGFSSGARFVLIKRTDSTGDWEVYDTERGIVAGNDSHLQLNTTAAQFLSADTIDPYSAGFTVNVDGSDTRSNESGASYIFYAIA